MYSAIYLSWSYGWPIVLLNSGGSVKTVITDSYFLFDFFIFLHRFISFCNIHFEFIDIVYHWVQ